MMLKKILIFLFFVLVMGCTKNKAGFSSKVDVELSTDSLKEAYAFSNGKKNSKLNSEGSEFDNLAKNFKEQFQNILPRDIQKNILTNFSDFLSEAKSLLENDGELLILVDKKHLLPSEFVPSNLIELKNNEFYSVSKTGMKAITEAAEALKQMGKSARAEGVTLVVSSAYRSYNYQKNLFARYAKQSGEAEADRFSARAGTSQHQLGTAFDFGSITDAFAKTKAGKWLDKNALRFGFSLSFPEGYEEVTGFKWECWHYRYIGVSACKMQEKWFNGIQQYTLEVLHWCNSNIK